MNIDSYRLVTVADDPAGLHRIEAIVEEVWPAYVLHASVSGYSEFRPDWMGIYRRWPQFQFLLVDPQGQAVAAGNCAATAWDGHPADLPQTGWDWILDRAGQEHDTGQPARNLVGLSVSIPSRFQGQGLSRVAIRAMHALAQNAGLGRVVIPVRPTWKARYPLIPIDAYAAWTNDDGLPFDPWLRQHVREGAAIAQPCARAMTMGGKVADWEAWLEMPLPTSGQYTHPLLLSPLAVDRQADRCVYVEPNVWVVHDVS